MRVAAISRKPIAYVGGITIYGTWTTISFNMTGTNTTGLIPGQFFNSDVSTSGISPATADTISSITNATTFVYGATHATTAQTQKRLNVSDVKGALTSGTNTITLTFRAGAAVTINSISPADFVSGLGIPGGSRVVSVDTGTSVVTISRIVQRSGQFALTFLR